MAGHGTQKQGCLGLAVLLITLLLGIRWLVGLVAGFLKGIMLIGFVILLVAVAIAILLLYHQQTEKAAQRQRSEHLAGSIVRATEEKPPTD